MIATSGVETERRACKHYVAIAIVVYIHIR